MRLCWDFHKDPVSGFYAKLLTDRETNRQTDKRRAKQNLLGRGNGSQWRHVVSSGALTDGVTLFFPQKVTTFSLSHRPEKWSPFSVIVTTPILSAFQLIISPVFFVDLTAKKLDAGCCHPGRSALPSDATKWWLHIDRPGYLVSNSRNNIIYTLYFANQRQHITDMKTILQTLTRCTT